MSTFEGCCILLSFVSLILQAIATFSPQRCKNSITISTIASESSALPPPDREVSDE